MRTPGRKVAAALILVGAMFVVGIPAFPSRDRATVFTPSTAVKIRKVVVYKEQRRLELHTKDGLWKSYRVALGGNPLGHKTQQGDSRTPEGAYVLDRRNPRSQFHRSIHISYPNAADRASARRRGVSAGGDIFIHGLPNGMGAIGAAHTARDWTDGCIAVTNEEIEEIWRVVRDGTPIQINP